MEADAKKRELELLDDAIASLTRARQHAVNGEALWCRIQAILALHTMTALGELYQSLNALDGTGDAPTRFQ